MPLLSPSEAHKLDVLCATPIDHKATFECDCPEGTCPSVTLWQLARSLGFADPDEDWPSFLSRLTDHQGNSGRAPLLSSSPALMLARSHVFTLNLDESIPPLALALRLEAYNTTCQSFVRFIVPSAAETERRRVSSSRDDSTAAAKAAAVLALERWNDLFRTALASLTVSAKFARLVLDDQDGDGGHGVVAQRTVEALNAFPRKLARERARERERQRCRGETDEFERSRTDELLAAMIDGLDSAVEQGRRVAEGFFFAEEEERQRNENLAE
ncbi:hypothetical protein JCM11491_000059 [Sporobolomyces phaffii]